VNLGGTTYVISDAQLANTILSMRGEGKLLKASQVGGTACQDNLINMRMKELPSQNISQAAATRALKILRSASECV